MAKDPLNSLVQVGVTPRFEIFYALRTLHQAPDFARDWSRQVIRSLPKEFEKTVLLLAPRPMVWPLLADTLRDSKPDPTFEEIINAIQSLDDAAFQRAILGGVFRGAGAADAIASGRQSLRAAVETEARTSSALVSLIGLHPFQDSTAIARMFGRIVSDPTEYRLELSRVLEMFWETAFENTWRLLEPRMQRRGAGMRRAHKLGSFATFAREEHLPAIFDDGEKMVNSARGTAMFPYGTLRGIHLIPSAFNDARLWGAYSDADGTTELYFPVYDAGLLRSVTAGWKTVAEQDSTETAEPALGFRALGDTTRYAIASVLAGSPRTSAELAKEFGVSKATISHHVHVLRGAGLLIGRATDHGTALTLDRNALESLSWSAAKEMFAEGRAPIIRRSRHEAATRKKSEKRKKDDFSNGPGE